VCGRAADPAIRREGEAFCSARHAEEFMEDVTSRRAAKSRQR
jgi:hypothetical protein